MKRIAKKDYPKCEKHHITKERRGADHFVCKQCENDNNPIGVSEKDYAEWKKRKDSSDEGKD